MQRKALAGPFADLTFEHIIPKQSSTRHIAASGFYHCLGKRQGSIREEVDINLMPHSIGDERFGASGAI